MSNDKELCCRVEPKLRYAVKGRMLCWREFCYVLVILLIQSRILRGSVRDALHHLYLERLY